jgi:hypothetical protein
LSGGWTVVVAIFTSLTGLLVLWAIYLWRGGHKVGAVIVAGVFALIAVAFAASLVGSGSGSTRVATLSDPATPTTSKAAARACSSYHGAKPQSCVSRTGFACSSYDAGAKPEDCFTAVQMRARAKARKADALAVAKARRKALAAAKARARAHAAYVAAANAWHKGYYQQDENVYWKWVNGNSCQDYAQNGCWHVAVITRDGCPSYVAVNANEYQGSSIVNALLANQGYGIPAKTERVFELDADSNGDTANNVTIDCN